MSDTNKAIYELQRAMLKMLDAIHRISEKEFTEIRADIERSCDALADAQNRSEEARYYIKDHAGYRTQRGKHDANGNPMWEDEYFTCATIHECESYISYYFHVKSRYHNPYYTIHKYDTDELVKRVDREPEAK